MPIQGIEDLDAFTAFIQKETLVAVDFFAVWCGPCKVISPKFEELSEKFTNVKFVKVDVDNAEDIAGKYGISAMPTFLFFKNGEKVDELKGADPKGLEAKITSLAA